MLGDISTQLTRLEQSLGLVREDRNRQTAVVQQQVEAINKVAEELRSCLAQLATGQQKSPLSQVVRSYSSGARDDRELEELVRRLDRARDQLVLQISMAQVGLVGNLKDSFRVAFDVLQETNGKVNKVLGINLVLAERLKDRPQQQTADGTVLLDEFDLESLGFAEQRGTAAAGVAPSGIDATRIYDNVTVGQARIMTGDVGVDSWHRAARRRTTIAHNQFGQDVRIMTGDQGGEAAKGFNENFWK